MSSLLDLPQELVEAIVIHLPPASILSLIRSQHSLPPHLRWSLNSLAFTLTVIPLHTTWSLLTPSEWYILGTSFLAAYILKAPILRLPFFLTESKVRVDGYVCLYAPPFLIACQQPTYTNFSMGTFRGAHNYRREVVYTFALLIVASALGCHDQVRQLLAKTPSIDKQTWALCLRSASHASSIESINILLAIPFHLLRIPQKPLNPATQIIKTSAIRVAAKRNVAICNALLTRFHTIVTEDWIVDCLPDLIPLPVLRFLLSRCVRVGHVSRLSYGGPMFMMRRAVDIGDVGTVETVVEFLSQFLDKMGEEDVKYVVREVVVKGVNELLESFESDLPIRAVVKEVRERQEADVLRKVEGSRWLRVGWNLLRTVLVGNTRMDWRRDVGVDLRRNVGASLRTDVMGCLEACKPVSTEWSEMVCHMVLNFLGQRCLSPLHQMSRQAPQPSLLTA
ncbi:hypothetical protein BC829DRAFT_400153, partial [Chytridium lagenaria]